MKRDYDKQRPTTSVLKDRGYELQEQARRHREARGRKPTAYDRRLAEGFAMMGGDDNYAG